MSSAARGSCPLNAGAQLWGETINARRTAEPQPPRLRQPTISWQRDSR